VFDGLTVAHNELMSERNRTSADNVIVLLTDGIASRPLDESNPDYAEEVAALFAQEIKQTGTEIYTIGLGESVNDDFLKTIATEQQYYYTAPTRDDVEAIYEQIATAICKKGPNIIQIIPRAIQ
jgi:Mg-chelatase subunit ChlD